MGGLIHVIESKFKDFLTYSNTEQKQCGIIFTQSRWGGSFWQQELENPNIAEVTKEQVRRFYGVGDGKSRDARRVFVRAVNATVELRDVPRLYESLFATVHA